MPVAEQLQIQEENMADKLEKIGAELKRARVKRDEWNERVKILE